MRIPDLTKGLAVAAWFAASVSVSAVAVVPKDPPSSSFVVPGPAESAGTLLVPEYSYFAPDVTARIWIAKVTSRVYKDDPKNLAGGYTFEYDLENISNSGAGVSGGNLASLLIGSEPMSSLDVGYLLNGTAPNLVGFLDTTGQTLTWGWAFGISSGSKGATLVVHSPYKAYSLGAVAVLGSGTFQSFNNMFVPAVVPEPSTYAGLFAFGLAGFAAYRRFRA
jgi:hypothetical protein